MIQKTSCQHCGQHIEFEVETANQIEACPNCGKQTRLFTANAKGFKPERKIAKSKLAPCNECAKVISSSAIFCPHCGDYKKVPFGMILSVVFLGYFALLLLDLMRLVLHKVGL